MKIGRGVAVQRHLGQLFEGQSVAGLGEVQLLERFVERRDEPAFAALVARHGPMVLGVCRRLLVDPLDVEDAFQATFLVLVRRAGSLRDRDRLAPWLFGVARRVATRARSDLARRKAREGSGVEEIAGKSDLDDPNRELGRALIEEIDRLPGALREPILLCCVEGLSYDEAADRLGSTVPAIRGKLARARGRLRDRLSRRGFAPMIAASGVWLSVEAASAAVPLRLLTTTIQVSKAGTVPAGIEFLAEGVIRTMILTKSKILAAALVTCGIAGSSMGLIAQDGPADSPARRAPADADRLDKVEKKLDRVLQALEGKPAKPPQSLDSPTPDEPPPPPAPPTPGQPSKPPTARANLNYPFTLVEPQLPSVPQKPEAPPQPPISARSKTTRLNQVEVKPSTNKAQMQMVLTEEASPATDRIDALEQKLKSLEARLDKLERLDKLDAGPESSVEAPKSLSTGDVHSYTTPKNPIVGQPK